MASRLETRPSLFGTALRTRVLTAVAALEETYPVELARILGSKETLPVRRVLSSLEREGVIASRPRLGVRQVFLDPRYFAAKELRALLERLAKADPVLSAGIAADRRRPRRVGKSV